MKKNIVLKAITFGIASLLCIHTYATELLVNGDFETFNILPGWDLTESITGMPGVPINSAELNGGFANNVPNTPGETGLWLKSFSGNRNGFNNEMVNAILSQTVPGSAGETYTFQGDAKFEQNCSCGVLSLDAASPSGSIASPSDVIWEMEFLDNGGTTIGSPVTLDLRTVQLGDNLFHTQSLMGVAPVGTAEVRVTASALNMVDNINPMQSGAFDNFSLVTASAPGTDLLVNGNLNDDPINPGWLLTESPSGADNIRIHDGSFVNNTPNGEIGLWFRPFNEGDATASQTVAAVPGADYTFSAWSKWEDNYSGGLPDTGTDTFLELAFLDGSDAVIGTPVSLDLRTVQSNDQTWREFMVNGIAPAGTVSARVSAIATGMENYPDGGTESAAFDDFSLIEQIVSNPADLNNDGFVDGLDLGILLGSWNTTTTPDLGELNGTPPVDGLDLGILLGAWDPPPASAVTAVPEPTALLCFVFGIVSLALNHRRIG